MRSPPVLIHLMKKSSLWPILRVQSGRRDLQHLRMGKYTNKVCWVMCMTKRFLKREKEHLMTQQNVSVPICAVNAHFHSVENRRRWHQAPDGRRCAVTADPHFSMWTPNLLASLWLTPLFLPLILYRTGAGKTGKKILRFVDKITKSKYFQKAAENEFIKKKFEEMSNTPLLLTVEVQELSGTLVINVPPPPTDRIWWEGRTRSITYIIHSLHWH